MGGSLMANMAKKRMGQLKASGGATGSTRPHGSSWVANMLQKRVGNAMNLSAKRKKRMARSNDYLATPDDTFDFAPTPKRGGYQG